MTFWKHHRNVLILIALGVVPFNQVQARCIRPENWLTPAVEQLADNAKEMMSKALVANLRNEGFSCTDRDGSAAGYLCISPVGYFPGYPKRVSLVISKKLTSVSHYHLHLHGWLLNKSTYESTLKDFDFEDRFPASEKNNSVLIIPESETHCRTLDNYFSKPGALDEMIRKVNSLVGRTDKDITAITLSGHSGAQVPVSMVLRDSQQSYYGKKINTVLLFDATYSDKTVFKPQLENQAAGSYQYDSMVQFAKWIQGGSNRTLISTYVEGSTTGPESIKLKSQVSQLMPKSNRIEVISYAPKPVPAGVEPSSYNHFQICYDQLTSFFKNYP